ncbi:hypothetical protein ACIQZB_32665 [Streptomyces sp. NPDC097727]|uniref:hypothetical protein n=1 Tax=Streptomyces sp. NPDC097727 TaxID=3366092 RepID=UPI00382392D5
MALSPEQRDQIERRIRAAIDRLLAGQIPVGEACDVKPLAAASSRAARRRRAVTSAGSRGRGLRAR